MSRIDVVSPDGKEFKVLVNCIQQGVPLHSAVHANSEARKLKVKYPKYTLTTISEPKKKD